MIIFDTNVWVAFLNESDSQHKKAKEVFNKVDEMICLPEYVILEVCSVLSLRAGKEIANRFAATVIDNKDIKILSSGNIFLNRVIKRFLDSDNDKLSFVDIALLCLSREHEVITFDESLHKEING